MVFNERNAPGPDSRVEIHSAQRTPSVSDTPEEEVMVNFPLYNSGCGSIV